MSQKGHQVFSLWFFGSLLWCFFQREQKVFSSLFHWIAKCLLRWAAVQFESTWSASLLHLALLHTSSMMLNSNSAWSYFFSGRLLIYFTHNFNGVLGSVDGHFDCALHWFKCPVSPCIRMQYLMQLIDITPFKFLILLLKSLYKSVVSFIFLKSMMLQQQCLKQVVKTLHKLSLRRHWISDIRQNAARYNRQIDMST